MADCFPFPPESDDLHWLPREIFADIGIVDTEAAVVVTEPTSEAAAAAVVEELAAQLAGILGGGGGSKVWPPLAASPPPAPSSPPPAAAAPRHAAKVCGLEGSVAMSFVGSGTNGGAAAVSWPFVPYPQFHWQVGNTLVNHGGVLDYPVLLPPALPCHVVPPPANLRAGAGTGVFLPRVEAYRYAVTHHPATAKGGAAARPSWAGTGTGSGTRPATWKKQQQQTEHATPTKQQQATGHAALALPQDWSYR